MVGGLVLVVASKFFAVFVVVVRVLVACPGSVLLSLCVNFRTVYLLSFVVQY